MVVVSENSGCCGVRPPREHRHTRWEEHEGSDGICHQARGARGLDCGCGDTQPWVLLAEGAGAQLSTGIPHADKIVHVAIFFFTTFVVLVLSKPRGWLMIATIVGMFVWGITVETIQDVIPGRVGDPWDVAADCLGIAIAGVAGWWVSYLLLVRGEEISESP